MHSSPDGRESSPGATASRRTHGMAESSSNGVFCDALAGCDPSMVSTPRGRAATGRGVATCSKGFRFRAELIAKRATDSQCRRYRRTTTMRHGRSRQLRAPHGKGLVSRMACRTARAENTPRAEPPNCTREHRRPCPLKVAPPKSSTSSPSGCRTRPRISPPCLIFAGK